MKKEFLISILLLFSWTLGLPQHDAVAQDSSKLTAAELQKLHLQRIQEKLNVYSEADVNFMQDMIVHHSQALVMSQFAPLNGASDEVQVLAARIINAQLDEIKIMQHWLLDRGVAAPAVEYNGIESKMTMIQPSKPDDGARMAAPATHNDDVKMSHEGMDHGAQDHGTMDYKIMDHEGMDHNSMDHHSGSHSFVGSPTFHHGFERADSTSPCQQDETDVFDETLFVPDRVEYLLTLLKADDECREMSGVLFGAALPFSDCSDDQDEDDDDFKAAIDMLPGMNNRKDLHGDEADYEMWFVPEPDNVDITQHEEY